MGVRPALRQPDQNPSFGPADLRVWQRHLRCSGRFGLALEFHGPKQSRLGSRMGGLRVFDFHLRVQILDKDGEGAVYVCATTPASECSLARTCIVRKTRPPTSEAARRCRLQCQTYTAPSPSLSRVSTDQMIRKSGALKTVRYQPVLARGIREPGRSALSTRRSRCQTRRSARPNRPVLARGIGSQAEAPTGITRLTLRGEWSRP